MAPKPAKPAGFGKKQQNKQWMKKLWFYGGVAAALAVAVMIIMYAEFESQAEYKWAATYERKCEACQTMITSGILTRSMIHQQERKRVQEERQQILEANPDAELPAEEEPKISSSAVLKYMCNEQQVDTLLANNRFSFENGYATIEDPDFGPSLKKLCWHAMNNGTMTKIFKRMLEIPTDGAQARPTLVSLSAVHFEPVCVASTGMCSADELAHGKMVDPQAEAEAAAETAKEDYPSIPEGGVAEDPGTHTEL